MKFTNVLVVLMATGVVFAGNFKKQFTDNSVQGLDEDNHRNRHLCYAPDECGADKVCCLHRGVCNPVFFAFWHPPNGEGTFVLTFESLLLSSHFFRRAENILASASPSRCAIVLDPFLSLRTSNLWSLFAADDVHSTKGRVRPPVAERRHHTSRSSYVVRRICHSRFQASWTETSWCRLLRESLPGLNSSPFNSDSFRLYCCPLGTGALCTNTHSFRVQSCAQSLISSPNIIPWNPDPFYSCQVPLHRLRFRWRNQFSVRKRQTSSTLPCTPA